MFHPRSRNDQGDYRRQADMMSAQRLVCLRHDAVNESRTNTRHCTCITAIMDAENTSPRRFVHLQFLPKLTGLFHVASACLPHIPLRRNIISHCGAGTRSMRTLSHWTGFRHRCLQGRKANPAPLESAIASAYPARRRAYDCFGFTAGRLSASNISELDTLGFDQPETKCILK
jgi:hypothetical protein